MILETEVWCHADEAKESMGMDSGDCWKEIAVDMSQVIAIKKAGENDFIGSNKSAFHFDGFHFVLNIDYDVAVKLWKQWKVNKNTFKFILN